MFGLFRKKVVAQYRVNIQPADLELQLKQGENLLEAVLERGIAAPFNCRVGACKTCQIKVLEGRPRSLIEREYVFSQEEIGSGAFLACQTRVESDLNIVWPGLDGGIEKHALHQYAELCMVQQMTPRIHRIQLTLESGMSWNPGQFAKLLPLDLADEPRCYSMVTSGDDERVMSFDITRYPDGRISSWLTNPENIGKPVRVEAPFGTFGTFRDEDPGHTSGPLLCVAGGSGIGAISGIIASRAGNAVPGHDLAPVILIVGTRDHAEIYGLDELRNLARESNFPLHACAVLDREPQESAWSGRRGYVAHHLEKILEEAAANNPKFHQPHDAWKILLCGPPPMVETSIDVLRDRGIRPEQISFDKYEQLSA